MELLETSAEYWSELASPLAGWDSSEADQSADIRWLQSTLNQVMNAGLTVDGVAGSATHAAIRAFQQSHGLTADGIAGSRTLAALRAALGGNAVPSGQAVTCTLLPVRQTLDRFAFGKHNIEPHHQPVIDQTAACMLASLNSPTPIDGLSLIGHTDPVGDDAANMKLGQQRAEAVADAIIASLQRQAQGRHFSFVFTPSSMGEQQQLPGDPALSRRVEIIAPFEFPARQPAPPPPPPFRSPLNPPRWGPILARVISPQAVLRAGNAVRHLIDAENPAHPALAGYAAMVDAIRGARGGDSFIYLLGWVCMDDFDMVTCDASTELRQLLADAALRGVQVRAIFWEQPIIERSNRSRTQASADRISRLPGGAAIIDGETLSVGAHHQKLLVVGGPEGALVGFAGGLDINPDRILPSTVVCTLPSPPIMRPAPEADIESMSGGGGDPLHDVHCRVEGPAAFDLLQTFVRRWDHHPDSRRIEARSPLRGRTAAVPPPIASPVPPGRSSTGESCSVVVGRTFNPRRGSGMPLERDIKRMLLAAIGNAQRFIYMEDQYLLNLDAAHALRAALPSIQHLTILIAGSDIVSDTPCIWTYRREFVTELTRGLPANLLSKVRIFQPVTPPIPPVAPPCSTHRRLFSPTFGRHTYVHAKCWVFDDELAVIGSANCNKRGWEHDTEIGAFIFDDRIPTRSSTRTFAQQLRMDLWSEHLDLPASTFIDGVTSAAAWLRPPTTAGVFPYCPDDDHDIGEFKCGAIHDRLVDPPAPP